MNNLLERQISSDLNLNKFNNESNKEHGNRLIYSALAFWARALVLGKSYTDLNDEIKYKDVIYHNVDIMHIQVRLTQIAYAMLNVISYSKAWINNGDIKEQSSNLASSIIEDLIFCHELTQLNDRRRLTNSPIRNANFKNNQLILGGEQWKTSNKEIFSVGLGKWVKSFTLAKNYKEIFNLTDYTSKEYYNSLLDSAFWKESSLEGQYKMFKVGSGLFYYQAWHDFNISRLPHGISLLKSVDVDGGYFLVKKDKNIVSTARLDKWYYEENEIYRIMYSLDSKNNTPAIFKAKVYDDYVLLHCHSKLPNSEMRILMMSSWPKRFYNDIYYRIIPKFLWCEIKDILNDLGIEVE